MTTKEGSQAAEITKVYQAMSISHDQGRVCNDNKFKVLKEKNKIKLKGTLSYNKL